MFTGGSGIAPFRSFLQARSMRANGRNLLFFGVKTRQTFLYEKEIREFVRNGMLEAHIAFSQDTDGLIYDRDRKELLETKTNKGYIDSEIFEHAQDLIHTILPIEMGGLGGYVYICGSTSLYETVSHALNEILSAYNEQGSTLLNKIFAEGRLQLDIFSPPNSISIHNRKISVSELARNTGHKKSERMWIGVTGRVYDLTEFIPVHPGGQSIIAANAGLDCTDTFDQVAHTNNGEVQSVLSKYFIGDLVATPQDISAEIFDLRNIWIGLLRMSVEMLTCAYLEIPSLENWENWFVDGHLDMCTVRKFHQFHSRLLGQSLSSFFGERHFLVWLC
jgi:cytochrome b involved in lipid metabolism